MDKVSPLILSLVHLHSFCIDQNEFSCMDVPGCYCFNLFTSLQTSHIFGCGADAGIVQFDELGHPVYMLGCGHHFNNTENNYQRVENVHSPNVYTLMDDMLQRVKDLGLTRPT
jgi:hypothetical protein